MVQIQCCTDFMVRFDPRCVTLRPELDWQDSKDNSLAFVSKKEEWCLYSQDLVKESILRKGKALTCPVWSGGVGVDGEALLAFEEG